MVNKVNNRRQRGKREASFLEHVRDLLEKLAADLGEVKQSVKELQNVPNYHPTYEFDVPGNWWDDWSTWYACGFQSSEYDATSNVKRTDAPYKAKVEIPLSPALSKTLLLGYWFVAPSDASAASVLPRTDDLRQQALCQKCKERVDDCICHDLFCRRCARMAQDCNCNDAVVMQRACVSCQAWEPYHSLHDEGPVPMLPQTFSCSICGGMEYTVDLEGNSQYYLLQGAQACQTCGRVDSQSAVRECNGCDLLHHGFCMHPADGPDGCTHIGQLYLCGVCKDAAIGACCPYCEVEASQPPSNEQTENSSSSNLLWRSTEIQIWVKATLKLAHKSVEDGSPLKQCLSIIDDRWSDAKPHIPLEIRESIHGLVQDIQSATESLFKKREAIIQANVL